MKDIYILQIETATPICSVALSKNGENIAVVEAEEPNLHASHITLFIEKVVEKADLALEVLSAVAVSMGPGSYTGLRIGVSTAKGLCFGLDIPLISIHTLEAMANGFVRSKQIETGSILVPMIDARRMEVYTAYYDARLNVLQETAACIVDQDTFVAKQGHYALFGTGADKFTDLFKESEDVEIFEDFRNSASYMDALAFLKFKKKDFEDVVYFEPFYLKDFVATTPKKRL